MLEEPQPEPEVETHDERVTRVVAEIYAKSLSERRASRLAVNRRYKDAHPGAANASSKRWRETHREKYKASKLVTRLKCTYGITPAERDALLLSQGGLCGICGTDDPSRGQWCVEHDHKSNKVRSIAHGNCNTGLGMFDEDIDRLRAAIAYLEKHK